MSYRFPEILELLPKKDDCCSCGHCTCEVYAAELLAGRAAADACPDITAEAKRMLRKILAAEQEVVSAIKGISLTDVKEVAASLLMVPGGRIPARGIAVCRRTLGAVRLDVHEVTYVYPSTILTSSAAAPLA